MIVILSEKFVTEQNVSYLNRKSNTRNDFSFLCNSTSISFGMGAGGFISGFVCLCCSGYVQFSIKWVTAFHSHCHYSGLTSKPVSLIHAENLQFGLICMIQCVKNLVYLDPNVIIVSVSMVVLNPYRPRLIKLKNFCKFHVSSGAALHTNYKTYSNLIS